MPEAIFGIPLKILFVLIVLLVSMAVTISLLFVRTDWAERIISIIGGVLQSWVR